MVDLRTRIHIINQYLVSAVPQQRPHSPGEDAPRRGGDLGLRAAGGSPADPQVRHCDDDGHDDDKDDGDDPQVPAAGGQVTRGPGD